MGWSIIAYFPQVTDTIIDALSSIASMDPPYLIMAKDYMGNIYMPILGIVAMPTRRSPTLKLRVSSILLPLPAIQ